MKSRTVGLMPLGCRVLRKPKEGAQLGVHVMVEGRGDSTGCSLEETHQPGLQPPPQGGDSHQEAWLCLYESAIVV